MKRFFRWVRASLFPRKLGDPAPEYGKLVQYAMDENRSVVIAFDKGGYAFLKSDAPSGHSPFVRIEGSPSSDTSQWEDPWGERGPEDDAPGEPMNGPDACADLEIKERRRDGSLL